MSVRELSGYVGRFAPSPTGPLHFGSLLAAVASYLDARRSQGQWLLRIEDIDPPREEAGASDRILTALDAYGFEWDGEVIYQSSSNKAHHEALTRLKDLSLVYPCGCSRRDLAAEPRSSLGTIYPGTCRTGTDALDVALRIRTDNALVEFDDDLQGRQASQLESESGDFVVLRRDGLIAYHLAVVVDDHIQGITDIVRGIDLMDSTARQIYLQQQLGYQTPRYAHIPIVINDDGSKLSKLTGAIGLPLDRPGAVLFTALVALKQRPPQSLARAETGTLWQWAQENWNRDALHGEQTIKIG